MAHASRNIFKTWSSYLKLTKILPLGNIFAAFALKALRSLTLSLLGVFETYSLV
jgi:hypothetical protein